jgi:hypothetical protein
MEILLHHKHSKIQLILLSLFVLGILSGFQTPSVSAVDTHTFNAPLGACFSYAVEVRNYTTGEIISFTANFPCKVIDINSSVVTVLQRWNQSVSVQSNDTLYSHYYISVEDIVTLGNTYNLQTKTYGGIVWQVLNITAGVIMTDAVQYDYYVYDNATGLALEGYKASAAQDTITHSWLTFYSENCIIPTASSTTSSSSSASGTTSSVTTSSGTTSSSSNTTTAPTDATSISGYSSILVVLGISIAGLYISRRKRLLIR